MKPLQSFLNGTVPVTVAVIVTRIHKHFRGRLYLREHRRHLDISAPRMAERMGIERESLLRLERKAQSIDWAKAVQYAEALGIAPARLLRPPGVTSLDELVEDQPAEVQTMAADIVSRLIARK